MSSLRQAGVAGDDRWLRVLAQALPGQLEAAFGAHTGWCTPHMQWLLQTTVAAQREHSTYIEPSDNWFTQNVKRFGGGFDMKQLTSEPGLLATKFDRLSSKYDHWVTGNRSRCQDWLARQAHAQKADLGKKDVRILDVACGIGLPAHQLRLSGYQGHISGTDISPGMVERSRQRGAYDELRVDNANEGHLSFASNSMDLILCMGAMELLDHKAVLDSFRRILKTGAQLWVSFQLEDEHHASEQHPTAHQNVFGITRDEITGRLTASGFLVEDMEQCDDAFYTPSPEKDGSLLPVPYIFVSARAS